MFSDTWILRSLFPFYKGLWHLFMWWLKWLEVCSLGKWHVALQAYFGKGYIMCRSREIEERRKSKSKIHTLGWNIISLWIQPQVEGDESLEVLIITYFLYMKSQKKSIQIQLIEKKQCDRFYKFHMENVFHCCIITIHIYILYMRFCS